MTEYMVIGITEDKIFYSERITAENRSMLHMIYGAKLGYEIASKIIGTYDFNITQLKEDSENSYEYSEDYDAMIQLCCDVCESYLEVK